MTTYDLANLERDIASHSWYHTLELAPGVLTPGWFDTRSALQEIPFPASLSGRRCLDVGTFDGFWAFEMERRGAAEVLAVDLLDPHRWDWPWGPDPTVIDTLAERQAGGRGFALAASTLGSSVQRQDLSVYDLDPSDIGEFDFVYVGCLLIHLRDPVRAVERIRAVARGTVIFLDAISLELSLLRGRPAAEFDGIGRPWWWKPNLAALAHMVESGGFDVIAGPRRVFLEPGAGQPVERPSVASLRNRAGRDAWVLASRGDPHAWLVARRRFGTRPAPSGPVA